MPEILDKKNHELQHLEPLGLLAGGIAHDFNNLLTAIMGNASLAHKHIESPEQLDIYLSRIQEASLSAAGLCKQMLAYAGKGHTASEMTYIPAAIEEMSRLLEVSLGKGISVKYTLKQGLPKVHVGEAHVQQLLMNLIMNANEAMQGQNGMIEVSSGLMDVDEKTITFNQTVSPPAGQYVYLEVCDSGCGMDAEMQTKIFDPFFTTKSTGHGLGMSAVLGIVYGHKGIIQIDSELGEGCRFRLAFPAITDRNQDDNMVKEYDALHKFQLSGKILLVDDEDIVLETMQVMLEDLGCETILAQDGQEAVDMYKQYQNDIVLVLLDLTMPKMSGQECVHALKAINPDVKIILSSGYSEEDVASQFKDVSLAGFLQKPCNLKQLFSALKEVL